METNKENRIVAVCGVTGHQGGAVARELLKAGFKVRGLTRDPEQEKAGELSRLGAQVVKCDLDKTGDVMRALKGAWGAFGVFNGLEGGAALEEQQADRFAVMAKNTGVQHYVYSSVASADKKTGIPFFDNKARVEHTLRALKLPSYTILRPAFFMENLQGPLMWPELERGRLSLPLKPETKLQLVAVEDIGRFGCMAFEKCDELNHAAIDLAGDEMTMPEAAEVLGEALNRKIRFSQAPIAEVRAMNPAYALMYEWFDRVGLSVNIPEVSRMYGLQPFRFGQWARKVKWPAAAR